MIEDKNGVKKWKQVEVKLEEHINVPIFSQGMTLEFYDECLSQYLSKIAMDQLPQTKPLWEIHILKYPTSNAAGNIIFKFHHALGDGYSLMGALLSCLQRAENPSLPLTFPSRQSNTKYNGDNKSIFRSATQRLCRVINTVVDFSRSLLLSTLVKDDRTPIRSGDDAVEFKPMSITTMTFSLDQLKEIKSRLKVTINDVITGIIFYGIRLYMEETSHKLSNSNSTAMLLLNTRNVNGGYKSISEMVKPNAEMPWGNHFTFLHVKIPNLTKCGSSKPQNFVCEAHRLIKRRRNSAGVYFTNVLLKTLEKFKGVEATAQFIHNSLKNSSMGISNLIGPMEKMALADHPIKGLYFNVVGAPQSLSVTVLSYVGIIRVSLGTQKGFIDQQKLKSCLQNSFDSMFEAVVLCTPTTNIKEQPLQHL